MNDIDHRRTFAFFAFAAGVLSLVLFLFPLVYAVHAPGEILPVFERHRSVYVALGVLMLVWATVSIPCVVAIGRLLGSATSSLVLAATLSAVGGIVLLGFAVFAFVGALLAIVAAAAAAPNAAAADYQAAVWSNLSFFLADPGLMILGLGQLLFARVALRDRAFPRAISLTGIVGGTAGLLTLVTYQTSILALIQFAGFGVWAIFTGLVLARRPPIG